MVKLSEKTRNLLKDDIISILYDIYPIALFTNRIAFDLRRNNEFVKGLLLDLKKEGYIEEYCKDKKGFDLVGGRMKWRLSSRYIKALREREFSV